jgi:P4 family phage/plasmid primase-like protien
MFDASDFTPREEGYFTPKGKLLTSDLVADFLASFPVRAGYRVDGNLASGVLYEWDPRATVWAPATGPFQRRIAHALHNGWSTHNEKEVLAGLLRAAPPLIPTALGAVAFENVVVSDLDPTKWSPRLQSLAWELLGYFLTRRRIDRKAIMLRGEGANGKSRFLALIENLLGPGNVAHLPLQTINRASSPELGGLRDKLANIVDDMGTAVGRDISNFKTAVTGGKISVNPKYQHPYEFEPTAKFAFAVNRLPHSPDTSAAWGTRWIIVPFDATFRPEDRIRPEVLDAGLIAEAPFIVTRAMHALARLIKRGHFDVPPSFDIASEEFEEASNPVLAWLHDGGATFDPAGTIKGTELFKDFQMSTHGQAYRTLSARAFYEMLRGVAGVQTYVGGGHVVRIKGLRRHEPLALPPRSTSGDVESA